MKEFKEQSEAIRDHLKERAEGSGESRRRAVRPSVCLSVSHHVSPRLGTGLAAPPALPSQ